MAPTRRAAAPSRTPPPPAKKPKTGTTSPGAVKTEEDKWVDVKPEPKSPTPPGKVLRGKKSSHLSAIVKPETPTTNKGIVRSETKPPDSPYPNLERPTPEECWCARDSLAQLHAAFFRHKEQAQEDGSNHLGPGNLGTALPKLALPGATATATATSALPSTETPYTTLHGVSTSVGTIGTSMPTIKPVLDSLVGTILSQNTTDATSAIAFANLKRAFPSWEEVRLSKPAPIELAVKCGGLATIKVARIQIILNTLHQERGEASLEYLRELDDESVKKELSRFKGVGPKTISCVLMFCLKRPDFPVDAHVWKIALSLGWIPKSASRDTAYTHLNRRYARTAFPNHRRLCVQEHPRLTLCFTRRKSPGRVQVRPSRATGGAR